jgi:hypothetical protein
MDVSDLLTVVLAVLGVVGLLGVAVIGFVMWRYRIPPRGLVAMIGALVYLVSPVDVLPEVMLGPIGLPTTPAQPPPLRSSSTSSSRSSGGSTRRA